MKFTNAVSTLALMAAAVHASPRAAKCSNDTTASSLARRISPNSVTPATGTSSKSCSEDVAPGSGSGSIADACDIGFATQNGGTTGGGSAEVTTCTSLEELTDCATQNVPAVCLVSGSIEGNGSINVTADTTIGGGSGSEIVGVGFRIMRVSNVILRNLKISKVLASAGDAVGIRWSNNIWIDHLDLSSDMDNGKDLYDGLCDVTRASDFVTISNTFFHDHFKGSLVGHADTNGAEDTGHLIVTYANNYFKNINSRGPSIRFGHVHIFNQMSHNATTGVNTRMGAQVLIESSVFSDIPIGIDSDYSESGGFATVNDVDLSTGNNTAEPGTLETVPYDYTLLGSANVEDAITASAGATLDF